ncbi:MAG: hypothetical protein EBX36_11105, partial [Planctomycetia bacterium]|nr:hypothetical protein [Planctomycetia bacterium]
PIEDLIIASGAGGGSRVEVYSGRIDDRVDVRLATAAPFADLKRRNAAVTAVGVDTNQDGVIDSLVVSQGAGGDRNGIRSVPLVPGTRSPAFSLLTGGAKPVPLRVTAANNGPPADIALQRAMQAAASSRSGTTADTQAAFAQLGRDWGGLNGNRLRSSPTR